MTTFAYLRVSTIDQNTEKNKNEILKFANAKELGNVKFIEENITSKTNYKNRLLGEFLDILIKGDILIIPEFSRLARSVAQILEIINYTTQKGITLYSLKENFCNTDKSITATVTSTIFALVAQIERELISLRTKEALKAKKDAGIKLGRPKGKKGKSKLDSYQAEIIRLLNDQVPKTVIAKRFNTTIPNLYNYIKHLQNVS